jgi:signal transduction histidine kinase
VQGSYAKKLDSCNSCDFYRITQVTQHSHTISQKLVDLCPIGIIGVNRLGIVTIFNPAAERLLERERGAVLGILSITEVYTSLAEARRLKKLVHSPEHGGPGILDGVDAMVRNVKGQSIPIRLWAFIMRELEMEVGSVGFFYDQRQEKASQQALLVREKLESVLQLAGAVLHHLAQPMQILIGDVNLLMEDIPNNNPGRESVEAIAQGVQTINHLLEKIRHLSSIRTADYVGGSRILDLDNKP